MTLETPAHAPKNDFIEWCRGFAVMTVVIYHYTDRLPPEALNSTVAPTVQFGLGKIGVAIFFVISGFLITQSMQRSRTMASFYAKRISRIWPLFIAACVFTFVFLQIFEAPRVLDGAKRFYVEERDLLDLVGSILFLEDLPGIQWIDGAYWSIVSELKFYLWICILYVLFPRRFDLVLGVVAVLISSVSALDALKLLDGPAEMGATILNGIFVAKYACFFAVGVLLARQRYDVTLLANVLLCVLVTLTIGLENPNLTVVSFVKFGIGYALFVLADHWLLRGAVFRYIGRYSYGLYLFHQMIGLTIISALTPAVGIDAAIVGAFLVVMAITVVMSEAVEWRFRKPVEKLLERIFGLLGLAVVLPGRASQGDGAKGMAPAPTTPVPGGP